jgi:hypothetical protein
MRFIGSLDGDNIYRERFAWGGSGALGLAAGKHQRAEHAHGGAADEGAVHDWVRKGWFRQLCARG